MRLLRTSVSFMAFTLCSTGLAAQNDLQFWDFRPPVVAECRPYAKDQADLHFVFGAMSNKRGDTYVLFRKTGEQLVRLLAFPGHKNSAFIASPVPDPIEKAVKTVGVINGLALNGDNFLMVKMDLKADGRRLFLGDGSSVSVNESSQKKGGTGKFIYDLHCDNIFSNDNRYAPLVKTLFKGEMPELS